MSGTERMQDCASGKYNNELGLSACKDCASGKHNNELGLSACKDQHLESTTMRPAAVLNPMCRDQHLESTTMRLAAVLSMQDCASGKYNDTTEC